MLGYGWAPTIVLAVAVASWVFVLVDALRRPEDEWRAAGQDKFPWVLLIVTTGTLGAILYWANPRHAMNQMKPRR